MTARAEAAERTRDAFLGGRVTLVQPRDGHRAGLDAALLQALVPADAAGLAIDLGAGVGTVAFAVAARAPALSAIGIERDPDLVACGLQALALPENSGFAKRARLIVADIGSPQLLMDRIGLAEESADWVLMNPPFDPKGGGTRSPDPRRRAAHVGAEGLIAAWSAAAATLLRRGGTLGLIHRAEALQTVLSALSPQFGGIRVIPVHPAAGAPATRILVTALRGRRTPLSIAPGLVLHATGGAWTPEADALLRGEAELPLSA